MFPDCFFEYYQSQYQKIKKNYILSIKYFDVEGIHDLRVEIKRLRAFFNLVEWINPNFQAKQDFKKIRKLFKAAGRIRDVHVQQALARRWIDKLNLDLSEYYNFLKQKEMEARPEFSVSCKKFDLSIFKTNGNRISKLIKILPGEYAQSKTEEQFRGLIDELIKFKNKENLMEEDYHQIRILSKAARYTLEILQRCFSKSRTLDELNEKLREVHQALGKWHDDDVGLQSLGSFMKDYAKQPFFNVNSYDEFSKKLLVEKESLLVTFEEKWNNFLGVLDIYDYAVKNS